MGKDSAIGFRAPKATGMYVIYDKLAEEAGPIFQAPNDDVALRNFRHLSEGQSVDLSEYDVYAVGMYDPYSMSVSAFDVPRLVQKPKALVKEEI